MTSHGECSLFKRTNWFACQNVHVCRDRRQQAITKSCRRRVDILSAFIIYAISQSPRSRSYGLRKCHSQCAGRRTISTAINVDLCGVCSTCLSAVYSGRVRDLPGWLSANDCTHTLTDAAADLAPMTIENGTRRMTLQIYRTSFFVPVWSVNTTPS